MQRRGGEATRRQIDRAPLPRARDAASRAVLRRPGDRRYRHRLQRHGPQSPRHRNSPRRTFSALLTGDRRLIGVLTTTFIYVVSTLAIFNVAYGLFLALATTALPQRTGAFFRAVWLLPRMSPSVVYALLWSWVVAPTDYGLLNQALSGARTAALRHEERRADAADRARQRLHRRVVRHDHLHQRHPLDSRASLPRRAGGRRRRACRSSATSRCRRSAGS